MQCIFTSETKPVGRQYVVLTNERRTIRLIICKTVKYIVVGLIENLRLNPLFFSEFSVELTVLSKYYCITL